MVAGAPSSHVSAALCCIVYVIRMSCNPFHCPGQMSHLEPEPGGTAYQHTFFRLPGGAESYWLATHDSVR
jgi:hypothetical protein